MYKIKGKTTPEFVANELLLDELNRIRKEKIPFAQKNEEAQKLAKKLSSISSVKSVEIKRRFPSFYRFEFLNPYSVKVHSYKGFLPPYFSVSKSFDINLGWANFVDSENETIELGAQFKSIRPPKLIMHYNIYDLKNADFSLHENCFSTLRVSVSNETQYVKKQPIRIYSFDVFFHPKHMNMTQLASLSVVSECHETSAPLTFLFDPSPYLKVSYKLENKALKNIVSFSSEFACLVYNKKKQRAKPMVKFITTLKKKLGLGFSAFCTGGMLISRSAVPFAEKFQIGGIELTRGIESRDLCMRANNFPSGSDMFASGTLDYCPALVPNVNPHFFVNGAFSANLQSNNMFDVVPRLSSVLSVGTGIKFQYKGATFEANVQFPYKKSDHLHFLRFQLGVTPI
ncbi:hypothetical protein TRFO_14092 [Tritrichomonas foetus]|uniref:Bacterial surface antigen (D15) domain-containing protein n=1 Tax=Tritrichomonas foetus TaxID=1144522 RepID=A0A1J4L0K3_9EUKA|nr:hypothetical protein TRFO_14092 [Tritrichomonas foetus]|eukprot:OHT15468.1 hypothetical protein TRFO_14092 [Tritrichomonas foetus]